MKLKRIEANFWLLLSHLWLFPVTALTIVSVFALYAMTGFLIVAIPAHKKEYAEGRKQIIASMQPFLSSGWCDLVTGSLWFISILWLILRT